MSLDDFSSPNNPVGSVTCQDLSTFLEMNERGANEFLDVETLHTLQLWSVLELCGAEDIVLYLLLVAMASNLGASCY